MAVDIGPFQRIVNVNWGGVPAVLALSIRADVGTTNEGSLPALSVSFEIGTGTESGDVLSEAFNLPKAGSVPPAPSIVSSITPDLLAYYAIWSIPPLKPADETSESTGGGFWFINPEFATFPDFVPSPYASLSAAEAYLDQQRILHPEYEGGTAIIDFMQPFDTFSRTVTRDGLVFINLRALPKNATTGNIEIPIKLTVTGDGFPSGTVHIDALMFLASNVDIALLPDYSFFSASVTPVASFRYSKQGDSQDFTFTILAHPDPTIALIGPTTTGGGGGG